MKAIYFDLDGTLYDLYNVEDWEARLHAEDPTAYAQGSARGNMYELNKLLNYAVALGITVGVITWTAMQGTKEYNKRVRAIKKSWVENNIPCVSEFHCVKYGTPKHRTAKEKDSVLIDDNAQVREAWKNGATIDATNFKKMLEILENMLDEIE